jgi:hypothetical protein
VQPCTCPSHTAPEPAARRARGKLAAAGQHPAHDRRSQLGGRAGEPGGCRRIDVRALVPVRYWPRRPVPPSFPPWPQTIGGAGACAPEMPGCHRAAVPSSRQRLASDPSPWRSADGDIQGTGRLLAGDTTADLRVAEVVRGRILA